ncbi:MAG TPA: hypothetical protein VJQ56_12060 [Blastocatellia bacterium]|nr:hypothetical protein [Blastocatellia bacterium]
MLHSSICNSVSRLVDANFRARPAGAAESANWWLDLLSIIIFGAAAGLSMGLYTGGLHLVYVATKIPLLLLASLAIVLPSMQVLGRFAGCSLDFASTSQLALAVIARTAIVAGSLAPVTAYFALTLPQQSGSAYRAVVLSQVCTFAVAGSVGVAALSSRLAELLPDKRQRQRLILVWLGIYSFVGAQVTWLLRPLLGTPGLPVEYIRSYGERLGLESNFYISVYRLLSNLL